jgi:hypothetical protein
MKRLLPASLPVAPLAFCKTFTHAQPGGGEVAWLLNERGARNTWMAAGPAAPRKIGMGHTR